MRKYKLIAFIIFGILSCHRNNKPVIEKTAPVADSTTLLSKVRFENLKFDNVKDLTCNMPLTAGVQDTVHYKGKLYGFCSKECKDAFLKNPSSYLTKTK